MSKLEEVKAKIQAGELSDAMSIAISEAMKLEIVTFLSENEDQPSPPYLRTLIDLLDNEIEYQISEQLMNNNFYNQIKQVHVEQVQQANERILKNVESLQKMFSLLNNSLKEIPQN
jgi:ABC-type Zn uptake system ZnuABC Zn-binding protein ZnuA